MAILVALGSACPSSVIPSDEVLEAAFERAVADAHHPTPEKIVRHLTAIVPHNDALVWEGDPGASRVLMVTWTSYPGYIVGKTYHAVGREKYQPSVDLWVTAVPEVKLFCRRQRLSSEQLELRLKQYLGMPASTERTWFVEFWVEPTDLFRPSPDPEITDHEAELDFRPNTSFMTVSSDHIDWINHQISTNMWPWTRLGYTYDWGNPICHVGASEFVIRRNAEVTVVSITPTAEYLR